MLVVGIRKKQCESNRDQQRRWNLTRVILQVRICCIFIVVIVVIVVVVVVVVAAEQNDIRHSKSGSNPQFLTLLTSKCASRHNGVHFFDISTSKSGPYVVCFVHFFFQMCFAPQRRATFHLSSGQLPPHPPL